MPRFPKKEADIVALADFRAYDRALRDEEIVALSE